MTTTSAFDSTLASLGITRTTAANAVQPASAGGSPTLGQADFLKLMTAQMQNQDPFNPVDNTQMVAQMAQFSSLAGISDMSTTLKGIATKLGATTVSDATSYIGKTVLTPGKTAYPLTSGGLNGAVELDKDASGVKVTIADANGQILKSIDLGKQKAGTAEYSWDGTTDSGAAAGSGPFTISVDAQDSGKTVTSRNLVWAPVQSVAMSATGEPTLNVVGVGKVATSDVRQIG